jgi:hypothetical protein
MNLGFGGTSPPSSERRVGQSRNQHYVPEGRTHYYCPLILHFITLIIPMKSKIMKVIRNPNFRFAHVVGVNSFLWLVLLRKCRKIHNMLVSSINSGPKDTEHITLKTSLLGNIIDAEGTKHLQNTKISFMREKSDLSRKIRPLQIQQLTNTNNSRNSFIHKYWCPQYNVDSLKILHLRP